MGCIVNSLEPRPFPNHRGSTFVPSGQGPKLDQDNRKSNLAHSNWVGDNTLGNKQQGGLPIPVGEQQQPRNGHGHGRGFCTRLRLTRLIEK